MNLLAIKYINSKLKNLMEQKRILLLEFYEMNQEGASPKQLIEKENEVRNVLQKINYYYDTVEKIKNKKRTTL